MKQDFIDQVEKVKNNGKIFGFELNLKDYLDLNDDVFLFDYINFNKVNNTLSWYDVTVKIDYDFYLDANLEALFDEIIQDFYNNPQKWINRV